MSHKPFRRDSYRTSDGSPLGLRVGVGERTNVNVTSRTREALAALDAQRRAKARLTPASLDAWAAVHAELCHSLTASTQRLIRPIHFLGEHDGALILAASPTVVALLRRRYGRFLGDTIRSLSGYRGVFITEATPENTDGCL